MWSLPWVAVDGVSRVGGPGRRKRGLGEEDGAPSAQAEVVNKDHGHSTKKMRA